VRARGAEPLDLAFLQRPQQLGLQGRLEVADLVQEQRATVGQLEAPRARLRRPGERPLLVAEQLALDEARRQGRTVTRSAPISRATCSMASSILSSMARAGRSMKVREMCATAR
jgi:hypothetical protein